MDQLPAAALTTHRLSTAAAAAIRRIKGVFKKKI